MHVSPSFKRTDGEISSVFLNSSNTELAPARAGVNLLANFPFVASRRDVPSFAVRGEEITNAQAQEVEMEDSHMHIAALPRCCPIGYNKKWMEGYIFEQGFEEAFESEYGVERGQWLKAVKAAFTRETIVSKLCASMQVADVLSKHFGPNFASSKVTMGGPDVLVYSINRTSNQDEYEAIKGNLGAFEDLGSPASNPASALPVTLADIGSVLTSKSDRIENTRLAKGYDRQRSHYIGGIVDFNAGKLTSVALPLPTAAHVKANKEQTLEERVNETKVILDTANSFRTKDNIMAMESARSMPEHQVNLVRQMILGQFSKTPVKRIDQKAITAGIVAFMALSSDQVQKLGEELDKARAEAAQKKDQGDVNVELIVPSHLSGLKQVFGFLANYRSASDCRWISNQSSSIVPITSQGITFMFNILHRADVKEWYEAMPPEEILELSYHLTARVDYFISGMTAAGLEYGTQTAISAGKPEEIDLEAYRRVVERFSDDMKEIKKASTGGPKLNPALSIAPIRAPPRKVQKTSQEWDRNQGRQQHQQQPKVSFQGNDSQGRRSGGGGRNSFNTGAWGNPWPSAPAPRQRLSSEEKKKKGCLLIRPGSALVDYLAERCEKYCAPFQVKGLSCDDEGCTRRHTPFSAWSREEKEAQCKHVEVNKNQMKFAPGTRLEDKFQHLIKNGERN
jgi:hypothetical protein